MISFMTMKRLHRELWFWLERNPTKVKFDWPGWGWYEKDLPGYPFEYHYCFACLACIDAFLMSVQCRACGIIWSAEYCLEENKGYYWFYTNAATLEKIRHYARIIRTLPWRDEDKNYG